MKTYQKFSEYDIHMDIDMDMDMHMHMHMYMHMSMSMSMYMYMHMCCGAACGKPARARFGLQAPSRQIGWQQRQDTVSNAH